MISLCKFSLFAGKFFKLNTITVKILTFIKSSAGNLSPALGFRAGGCNLIDFTWKEIFKVKNVQMLCISGRSSPALYRCSSLALPPGYEKVLPDKPKIL